MAVNHGRIEHLISKIQLGLMSGKCLMPDGNGSLGKIGLSEDFFNTPPKEVILFNTEPITIEYFNDNLISHKEIARHQPFQNCLYCRLDMKPFDVVLDVNKILKLTLSCLWSTEFRPGEMIYYTVGEIVNSVTGATELQEQLFQIQDDAGERILSYFLRELNKKDIGVEKVQIRSKVKHNGEKKLLKIKSVIHIGNRRDYPIKENSADNKIDWSHAWAVRGHWRKIDGIGKDRDGKACIKNFTWVRAHTKGNKEKEFVSKVRVVKKPSNS